MENEENRGLINKKASEDQLEISWLRILLRFWNKGYEMIA